MVIKNSSVRIGIGSDVAVRAMLLYAMVCDSCCNIGVAGADTARKGAIQAYPGNVFITFWWSGACPYLFALLHLVPDFFAR